MTIENYDELSRQLLAFVGDKKNITYFAHCFTRLRFNVKDKGLVKEEDIKKLDKVVGIHWVGEQLQIIIGQEVEDIYRSICKVGDIQPTEQIDEIIDEPIKKKWSFKGLFNDMIAAITACITPILVVFVIGGLFKLAVVLLGSATFGILPDDSDLIVLLTIVAIHAFVFSLFLLLIQQRNGLMPMFRSL